MAESGSANIPTPAIQKKRGRKRTLRACDECRMRKSKCDGLKPCETCQSTDRYCTYDLSARWGNGPGTRVRVLEDRLRRARAYLNEAQKRTLSLAHVDFDALLGPLDESVQSGTMPPGSEEDDEDQEKLDSMMDSYGQMTMNQDAGMERDFYGAASGLAWIQRARTYFGDTNFSGGTRTNEEEANKSAAVQLFDTPLPSAHNLRIKAWAPQLLPPRATATKLLHVVFRQVYPMFHFLYEQDFQDSTDRIYDMEPIQYQESDRSFLSLFHLVIGLGYLLSIEEHDKQGCTASDAHSMRQFTVARTMLDIAHIRTVVSLQSILCVILYLISSARMASAHTFLGAACASALRQGLHFRSTHESSFPEKEKTVRRRVFWTVMNLDMYVSGVLGLPPFIDLEAVDPAIDLTIEVALREARTDTGLSSADGLATAATAKHIELMRIMSKAQRALFPKPTDPPEATRRNGTILVSVAELQKIEKQYQTWAHSLTEILAHPDNSIDVRSIKYELQIFYYFTQIVLYRAFLHHLAKQHKDRPGGQRQLSYAQTCVRMARKVIGVSIEHQRKGLLCPVSWPSVYTTFLSVVCLVFAHATREEGAAAPEIKEDIEHGIRLLACTACTTDTGSVRCLEVLRRLIKSVSYAVDVSVEKICAETKLYCATEFTPTRSTDEATGMDELLSSTVGNGSSVSETALRISQAASTTRLAEDGHIWSPTPDAIVTQPALSTFEFSAEPQAQPYIHLAGEMVEVPYGGIFSWPGHGFHAAPGQPDSSSRQQEHEDQNLSSSNMPTRLTSQDIAAFMHITPGDEPFRTPR